MRMWMVDPRGMCRTHLLGEHVELHMLLGSLQRGKQLTGFLAQRLLEPQAAAARHTALVAEMQQRGFRHASPLGDAAIADALTAYPPEVRTATVDREAALTELMRRCPRCREGLTALQVFLHPTTI